MKRLRIISAIAVGSTLLSACISNTGNVDHNKDSRRYDRTSDGDNRSQNKPSSQHDEGGDNCFCEPVDPLP
jgi:hypothetical protein